MQQPRPVLWYPHKIAKSNLPFLEGECVKEYLVDSVVLIGPEKKKSLTCSPSKPWQEGSRTCRKSGASAATCKCHVLTFLPWLGQDLWYPWHSPVTCTVFVRGWMDLRSSWQQCAQWKRQLPVYSFTEVHACMEMLGVNWDSLVDVPTDSCPNLTGKNVWLLKRMQQKVTEINSDQKLLFLQHIIHVLSKSRLEINHLVNIVPKSVKVNFMRTWALHPRQFCASFGGEWD